MIITWYADFDGSEQDLEKINRIFGEIPKNIGGSVDGPYYPQSEALMYVFKSAIMTGSTSAGGCS